MNRFVRLIKENVVPFIVFMVIAVSCCGAWFFFHPSSPYHDRYSFVVSFQAVGTLSPGNLVAIQGIPCGEITKVELTDEAVYVTARVLATTVSPVNSDFRLINSGLMGEREMCILSGDSSRLVADGDTLVGFYDAGTSGIGKKISTIISDVSEIKDTLKAGVDSLSVGATGKSVDRVFRKGRVVTQSVKGNFISWKEGAMGVLNGMDHSLEDAKATLNAVSAKGGASLNQVDGFLDRINDLLANVQKMKGQSEEILGKLLKEDNSAGLLMDSRSQFNEELNKLLKDVDRLLEDIKKSGLNINIDIF